MKKQKDKKSLQVLMAGILSAVLFILLAVLVSANFNIVRLDELIDNNIASLWNPIIIQVMIFITNIVSMWPLIILSAITILLLIYKKRFSKIFVFAGSMIAGLISEIIIKELVQRARPIGGLTEVTRSSFPSGHATIAAVFFLSLIYCFKNEIKNKVLRKIFIIGCIILPLLIGFSRIYLKVHWFNDVLAGFFLGIFWLCLFIFLSKIKIK